MTGWFALALIVAVVIATAAIFAAGRKAGAAAEAAKAREAELKSQKEASDAKARVLEAGAAAPRDRGALADRLRDGAFQARLADEIQRLPPGAALERAMLDYARLRDQARACPGMALQKAGCDAANCDAVRMRYSGLSPQARDFR